MCRAAHHRERHGAGGERRGGHGPDHDWAPPHLLAGELTAAGYQTEMIKSHVRGRGSSRWRYGFEHTCSSRSNSNPGDSAEWLTRGRARPARRVRARCVLQRLGWSAAPPARGTTAHLPGGRPGHPLPGAPRRRAAVLPEPVVYRPAPVVHAAAPLLRPLHRPRLA